MAGMEDRLPDVLRVCREALTRDGAARDAYLDAACGNDQGLRGEVDALLATPISRAGFLESPAWSQASGLLPGTRLGPYEVRSLIGEGGMGQVYRGVDTRLGRDVAIKILPAGADADASRLALFVQEARIVAGLNHPHICALHDVGELDGTRFLVMELVEGQTLATRLREGPLPLDVALRWATEIADAVSAAHRQGVIHRDLKPSNVMVTPEGPVKVLDFGVALRVDHAGDDGVPSQHDGPGGRVLGTAPYMSPEQIAGGAIDARSDVFSLGAVLHEMLTGQVAFRRESHGSTRAAILHDTPPPMRRLRADVPRDLDAVVAKCLEKEPGRRYASAIEVHAALATCASQLASRSERGLRRQLRLVIPLSIVTALVLTAASWWGWRWSRATWARTVALPEVERLLDEGRGCSAFRVLSRADPLLPGDPEVARIKLNSLRRVSFETDPPGADVFIKDYVDTASDAPADHLGRTPLDAVLVPVGSLRFRMSKPGYDAVEGYTASGITGGTGAVVRADLPAQGTTPAGMIRVPGSSPIEPFWLDRFEVTNRRFKAFVDGGGYARAELWPGPFVKDGTSLERQRAIASFVDASGRAGPSTWTGGTYAQGRDDYPVDGVSWHEAAAYCAFEGKSLPTVHHWRVAALQAAFASILLTSNFSGRGPAPVGSHAGLGPFGTYDTAGNVREWCLNASGNVRYVLGGAWSDPKYLYSLPDARQPFDRAAGNGFRCAKYDSPPAPALTRPLPFSPLSEGHVGSPADDEVYRAYAAVHTFERGPLDAMTDGIDDRSPFWRVEKVSYRAGYGNERVTAYLFLPRNAKPPYQAVITFPGTYAFDIRSSERLELQWFDFLVRGGRAVLHPIYKGTYERTIGGTFATYLSEPAVLRDLGLQWYKEVARSLDYLASRSDIDARRFAYHGISVGAAQGPRFMALEPRLSVGLLFWGGLGWAASEINPLHYASRSTAPTLMINGRGDLLFPYAAAQVPLFRLLGARGHDKRHLVIEDAGHVAFNLDVVRQASDWLDRYMGPVAVIAP